MPIVLTQDNYYSHQADVDYMSVSQFKDFAGTLAVPACESAALARFNGTREKESSTSMLVGSYIDAYFEGGLDDFVVDNMDALCTKASVKKYLEGTGPLELLAEFRKADAIIARLVRDPVFRSFTSGETQRIMSADLFGISWKIKMDFYFDGEKIVDMKIMKDAKPLWSPLLFRKVDFIHYWGYDIQGAVYQKVVELRTGRRLPFYIAYGTKEDVTDLGIVEVTQPHLDRALGFVGDGIGHVMALRQGLVVPSSCGTCAHCRETKVLTGPVPIDDIMPAQRPDHDDGSSDAPVQLF